MKAALFKCKLPSHQCKASHFCLCLATQASYPCYTTTGPPQPNIGFSGSQMGTVRVQPRICFHPLTRQTHAQIPGTPPGKPASMGQPRTLGFGLSTCSRHLPLFLLWLGMFKWGLSPPSKLHLLAVLSPTW